MFADGIGRGAQRIIDAMVRWLAYGHINPNILTVIGVAINVGSGLLFGYGYFFWAGIVLIVANLFDMLDGQVARLSGRVTRFGGFLDSSLDRLSDMVVFVGLMLFCVVVCCCVFVLFRILFVFLWCFFWSCVVFIGGVVI